MYCLFGQYSGLLFESYKVREVLKQLLKYGLFVKMEKCLFHVEEISFVEFLLTTEGGNMGLSRVSTIAEWPAPTNF